MTDQHAASDSPLDSRKWTHRDLVEGRCTAEEYIADGYTTIRDWIAEPITLKRGLTGAKPDAVCKWLFDAMGCEPDDEFFDLFPGSGAVTRAWESWMSQGRLVA